MKKLIVFVFLISSCLGYYRSLEEALAAHPNATEEQRKKLEENYKFDEANRKSAQEDRDKKIQQQKDKAFATKKIYDDRERALANKVGIVFYPKDTVREWLQEQQRARKVISDRQIKFEEQVAFLKSVLLEARKNIAQQLSVLRNFTRIGADNKPKINDIHGKIDGVSGQVQTLVGFISTAKGFVQQMGSKLSGIRSELDRATNNVNNMRQKIENIKSQSLPPRDMHGYAEAAAQKDIQIKAEELAISFGEKEVQGLTVLLNTVKSVEDTLGWAENVAFDGYFGTLNNSGVIQLLNDLSSLLDAVVKLLNDVISGLVDLDKKLADQCSLIDSALAKLKATVPKDDERDAMIKERENVHRTVEDYTY